MDTFSVITHEKGDICQSKRLLDLLTSLGISLLRTEAFVDKSNIFVGLAIIAVIDNRKMKRPAMFIIYFQIGNGDICIILSLW